MVSIFQRSLIGQLVLSRGACTVECECEDKISALRSQSWFVLMLGFLGVPECMTQVQTIWVDDPSGFGLQVDDPAQVSDPDDDGELFLGDGSGRANLNPLPVLFPPLYF